MAPQAPAAASAAPRRLCVERLGAEVAYGPMLALQLARQRQVAAGDHDDTLFLLEHQAVLTTGRRGRPENVRVEEAERRRRGLEVHVVGRGGDVTYHGPGQLVAYPIVRLQPGEQDLRGFVDGLEEISIRTAADFGVRAHRVAGLRGAWVGNDKLAAVGVRIVDWTTSHGLALNVAPDLAAFADIVPCGLAGRGVISLAALVRPAPTVAEVAGRLERHAGEVLGRRPVRGAASPLPTVRPADRSRE